MMSIYDADSPLRVYCRECWWSDTWDPTVFGREYDFDKTFFEQFDLLSKKVPAVHLFNGGNQINSDYCNFASNSKNCYLLIGGRDNENVLYTNRAFFLKDCMDIYMGNKLELCYEDIQCDRSYKLLYSQLCENCSNAMFLYDCRNCQDCFGCVGLRNKQYYIFNTPYTKGEYQKKIADFGLESHTNFEKLREKFAERYRGAVHKYAHFINASQSTGENLVNTKNCQYCFDVTGSGSENSKYTHFVGVGVKDSYDNYGMPRAEKVYETLAIGFESNENSDYYFSYFVKGSSRIYYSYNCISCQNLFGCVGLRHKQYCILNKQYAKEEYETLLPRIIAHMSAMPYRDNRGHVYMYGEFFAPDLSPFAYNETIAQEYFPLTEMDAHERGYRWKNPKKKAYQPTLQPENLPDRIDDAADGILDEIIGCAHQGFCNDQCTQAFKIIPQELQFYKKMNLPFPRLCPNCRHYQRLKQRNPLKLWHRQCMCNGAASDKGHATRETYRNTIQHVHGTARCPNEFETSYAPDRSEIVYCEQCYNAEVV